VISVRVFLCFEVAAAAALALWLGTRFPALSPTSLRSALGRCLVAVGFARLIPLPMSAVLHLPHGAYVALFGCVLPAFVAAFLAALWLLALLADRVTGGGGGHPARDSVR